MKTFKILKGETTIRDVIVQDCPCCNNAIKYESYYTSVACPFCHSTVNDSIMYRSQFRRVAFHVEGYGKKGSESWLT